MRRRGRNDLIFSPSLEGREEGGVKMTTIGVSVVMFVLVVFAIVEMHAQAKGCEEYLRDGFMEEERKRRCLE